MERPNSSASLTMSPEHRLSTLLKKEHFLSKILVHLVDDGLHECRRVCRKWYEICNKLPLRLKVDEEKIPLAVEKFPNATAVSSERNCCASAEGVQCSALQGDDDGRSWFSQLSEFRKLHSLTLSFPGDHVLEFETYRFPSIFDESPESNQMLQQLCSLEIWLIRNYTEDTYLCAALRCLTQLTKLALLQFSRELFIEPFTELEKIEDLNVWRGLTNSEGQFMFPSLTNLTHLLFDESIEKLQPYNYGVLETLLPYASSLQSIDIQVTDRALVFTNDWELSKAYRKLKAINVFDDGQRLQKDFVLDLQHLSTLTRVSVCGLTENFLAKSGHYPIRLASLTLGDKWSDADLSDLFASSKHLTQLTLNDLQGGSSLSFFTELQELRVETSGGDVVRDWTDIFLSLPQLKCLHLKSHCQVQVPSSCIAELKKLASLSLDSVTLDGHFFSAVCQIDGLTQLRLLHCGEIDSCLSEVNGLTNLLSLSLCPLSSLDPRSYIEHGSLLRLREFVYWTNIPEDFEEELFRRLPSLRRVNVYFYPYG